MTYLNLIQEFLSPTYSTSSALHSLDNNSSKARRLLDDRLGRPNVIVLAYHPVLPIDRILRHLATPKAKDRAVVRPTEDSDLVPACEDPRGVERVHVGLGARVGEPHPLQVEPLAYQCCVHVLLACCRPQVQADVVKGGDHGLADDGVRVAVYASAELADQVKIPVAVRYSSTKVPK